MVDNLLLEFQSRPFKGPVLREEATPGLGLELDDTVAAASLAPD